jgi:hypothetical protein
MGQRRLVICSAYLPYDSEDPPLSRELEELVHYCETENLPVMRCDSNAHHTVWGGTKCNERVDPGGISKFYESGDSKSGPCSHLLQWVIGWR